MLEWLRGHRTLSRLLVVVFSESRQPADVARAYSLGANSYIVKPKDADELVRIVERLQNYWLNIHTEPDQVLPIPDLMTG